MGEDISHSFDRFGVNDLGGNWLVIRGFEHPHRQLIFRRFKQSVEMEVLAARKDMGWVRHKKQVQQL